MQSLFAQLQNNNNIPAGMAGAFLAGVCGCLLVALIIGILFLLTLQKALSRCSPRNRTMEPAMVWLNLIPLFGLVWQFITVVRISESLQKEFRARGRSRNEDYGYTVGMAYCGLNIVSVIINLVSNAVPMVAVVGLPVGLIGLICVIVYWVKISGYSGQLASRATEYDDDDDDDDDDRPRKRRNRDDDDDDDDDDRPRRRR